MVGDRRAMTRVGGCRTVSTARWPAAKQLPTSLWSGREEKVDGAPGRFASIGVQGPAPPLSYR